MYSFFILFLFLSNTSSLTFPFRVEGQGFGIKDNTTGYLFGGYNGDTGLRTNNVYEFDYLTETFTQISSNIAQIPYFVENTFISFPERNEIIYSAAGYGSIFSIDTTTGITTQINDNSAVHLSCVVRIENTMFFINTHDN